MQWWVGLVFLIAVIPGYGVCAQASDLTVEPIKGSIENLSDIPSDALLVTLRLSCQNGQAECDEVSVSVVAGGSGEFTLPGFVFSKGSASADLVWQIEVSADPAAPGFPFGVPGDSLFDAVKFVSNNLEEVGRLLRLLSFVPWQGQALDFFSMKQVEFNEWQQQSGGIQLLDLVLDFEPGIVSLSQHQIHRQLWRKRVTKRALSHNQIHSIPARHFLIPGRLSSNHAVQAFLLVEYFEGWEQFPVRIAKSEKTNFEQGLSASLRQISLRDENVQTLAPLWKNAGSMQGVLRIRPGFVDFPERMVNHHIELDWSCAQGQLSGELRQKAAANATEVFFRSALQGSCLEQVGGQFEFELQTDDGFVERVQSQFDQFVPQQLAPGHWARVPVTENLVAETDTARRLGADRSPLLPVSFVFDQAFFATLELREVLPQQSGRSIAKLAAATVSQKK